MTGSRQSGRPVAEHSAAGRPAPVTDPAAGSVPDLPAVSTTSDLLRHLLSDSTRPYRRRWRAEVRRASPSDPHQSAVAVVLAQHLWDTGEVPEWDGDLPRRLKDVVARALGGRGISHRTLGWFIDAFEMTETDEQRLWHHLETDLGRPVPGSADPQPAVPRAHRAPDVLQRPTGPVRYRTESLVERLNLGTGGAPHRATTLHVLRAHQLLDHIDYPLDPPRAHVQVLHGGTAQTVATGRLGRRLTVRFPQPLRPGQTTVVELIITFPAGDPTPTRFHREVTADSGGALIQVQFGAAAVPQQVRWVEYRPGDQLRTVVPLRADQHTVHRFLRPERDCMAGFEWSW